MHARLGCVLHSSFDPRRLIFPGPLTSYHLTHPTKMPSLSTVKASSIKVFFKDFGLGEVFAVRSKRNRRTQCSSTTHHEGHDADIPSEFPVSSSILHSNLSLLVHSGSLARDSGLQVSIDISSATASHGDSFARTTSDVAQTFLPVIQAIASAIPIAGPPMQAAIGGLLSILQIIDVRVYFIIRISLDSNVVTETQSKSSRPKSPEGTTSTTKFTSVQRSDRPESLRTRPEEFHN